MNTCGKWGPGPEKVPSTAPPVSGARFSAERSPLRLLSLFWDPLCSPSLWHPPPPACSAASCSSPPSVDSRNHPFRAFLPKRGRCGDWKEVTALKGSVCLRPSNRPSRRTLHERSWPMIKIVRDVTPGGQGSRLRPQTWPTTVARGLGFRPGPRLRTAAPLVDLRAWVGGWPPRPPVLGRSSPRAERPLRDTRSGSGPSRARPALPGSLVRFFTRPFSPVAAFGERLVPGTQRCKMGRPVK